MRCEPDGRCARYHTPFADFPPLVHHSHPYYAILNAYLKFYMTEEKDMEDMLPEHKLLRDVIEKIHGLWIALHRKRMHPIPEGWVDDDEFAGSGRDAGERRGGDGDDEHPEDDEEDGDDETGGRQDGFGSVPMVSNTLAVQSSISMPAVAGPPTPYPEPVSHTHFSPLFSTAKQIVTCSSSPSEQPELDADDPLNPSDSASIASTASTSLRSNIDDEEGEDDKQRNAPLYCYNVHVWRKLVSQDMKLLSVPVEPTIWCSNGNSVDM
jgi:hypothetical protein